MAGKVRAGAEVGLVVVRDPERFRLRVCGTSVLARAIVALGRHVGTVYVWKGPGWREVDSQAVEREVRARENPPVVRWVDTLAELPAGVAMIAVAGPVVFQPELLARLRRRARRDGVVHVGCPGGNGMVVACAGEEAAAELVRWLAGGEGTGVPSSWLHLRPEGLLCEQVQDLAGARRIEGRLLAQTGKGMDTFLARNFDRRISRLVTRVAMRLPVTPNQLTVANALLGITGALLLASAARATQVAGAALLVLSVILDGSDGELARVKLMETAFGRKLDFFLDNVVNALAIFCAGVGASRQLGSPFWIQASAVTALCAVACVWPVYVLFFRAGNTDRRRETKRLDPVAVVETANGRDFVYLILALAVAGRIHWFVLAALLGLPAFLGVVLVLYMRELREARAAARDGTAA